MMRWWRRLFRSGEVERELDAELRYDFDRRVDDLVATGLSLDEARRRARLEFGGLDQIKELCRDARGTRWIEDVLTDARYAVRVLAKDRMFTAVAVAALGLGFAVNNTQFSIVDGYCLRGLPIAAPDRVVFVETRDRDGREGSVSYADFQDIRAAATTMDGLAAYVMAPVAFADANGGAEGTLAAFISWNGLRLLGRPVAMGRDFLEEDARPGAPAAVILSSRLWRARYGADPAIVGRAVRVNGAAGGVIGVMPDGFVFPGHAEVWMPLAQMRGITAAPRDARRLAVFGRLRAGVGLPQLEADLGGIARRLAAEHPATNAGVDLTAEPINAHFNGRLSDPAWIAFTIVGALVLLIACANVANLLLMRSAVRAPEIAMRAALGATRGRIVRQLLVECAVLALLGGALGVALSAAGLRLLILMIPPFAIPYGGFSFNGRVLAVLTVAMVGTVFVCGLAPALTAARSTVVAAIKSGGRTGTHDRGVRRWMSGFLTVEFGLAVLLVSLVGLSVQNFRASQGASVKIDRSRLLTVTLAPSADRYPTPTARAALYEQIKSRLAARAGIADVTFVSHLPLAGSTPLQCEREGQPRQADDKRPPVNTVAIDPNYFTTLALPLIRGRSFAADPQAAGAGETVINERAVRMYFGDDDPLGQRIRLAPDVRALAAAPWLTIVGVAPDIRQGPAVTASPIVYLPFRDRPSSRPAIIVKAAADPEALIPGVREAVRDVDADLPLSNLQTLRQAERQAGWNGRVAQAIITTIAAIALSLAAVGLYAVTAYGVAQRRREIGIRVVLGAGRATMMWLVLRGALYQVFLGFGAGLLLKTAWGRFLIGQSGQEFDAMNLGVAIAILAVVALSASVVPALRACRVDPLAALRSE